MNPTYAYYRKCTIRTCSEISDHLRRPVRQRLSAHTSGLAHQRRITFQPLPGNRRICRNNAGDSGSGYNLHDIVQLRFGQVWGNLQEYRLLRIFRMVQILQSIQNFLQWFFLLEVSEPRCIRRTDVDNKIVYIVKQCIETVNIVVYSFFVWCRLILAYVPSDNYILTVFQLFQTAGGDIGP